jgi:hypothetical protein
MRGTRRRHGSDAGWGAGVGLVCGARPHRYIAGSGVLTLARRLLRGPSARRVLAGRFLGLRPRLDAVPVMVYSNEQRATSNEQKQKQIPPLCYGMTNKYGLHKFANRSKYRTGLWPLPGKGKGKGSWCDLYSSHPSRCCCDGWGTRRWLIWGTIQRQDASTLAVAWL